MAWRRTSSSGNLVRGADPAKANCPDTGASGARRHNQDVQLAEQAKAIERLEQQNRELKVYLGLLAARGACKPETTRLAARVLEAAP